MELIEQELEEKMPEQELEQMLEQLEELEQMEQRLEQMLEQNQQKIKERKQEIKQTMQKVEQLRKQKMQEMKQTQDKRVCRGLETHFECVFNAEELANIMTGYLSSFSTTNLRAAGRSCKQSFVRHCPVATERFVFFEAPPTYFGAVERVLGRNKNSPLECFRFEVNMIAYYPSGSWSAVATTISNVLEDLLSHRKGEGRRDGVPDLLCGFSDIAFESKVTRESLERARFFV